MKPAWSAFPQPKLAPKSITEIVAAAYQRIGEPFEAIKRTRPQTSGGWTGQDKPYPIDS